MEKIINLYNRYGDKISLEYIETKDREDFYVLNGAGDYYRIIYNGNDYGKIDAIDPSGGPFMMVDRFSINNDTKILSSISENESGKFILSFKEGTLEK